MADQLSKGALRAIQTHSVSELPPQFQQPLLQVVQLRQLATAGQHAVRYRLVLSDSHNFVQCMLATQNNHLVDSEKLQKGSIVKLTSFKLELLEELGIVDKIGDPQALETAQKPQPGASAQVTPQPPTSNGNSFYGAKPEPARQMMQAQKSSHAGAHPNIYPIESLSPYQNKWTIKARVTLKSEIKHYHNQRGEGKLFTVHFLDQSGEIRATGFNERVDDLYDQLEEGAVYYVSKCRVNIAKKQFSTIQNEYELMFERDTEIERCNDATEESVPQVKFDFVPLGKIADVEKDQTIDVIAVLKEIHDVSEITSKTTQKPYSKRDLLIVDSSGYSIKMTVWGKTAQEFNIDPESVVAFKGVKESYDLKGWYDGQGRNESFATHAANVSATGAAGGRQDARKTLGEVSAENIGMSDQPDYYTCKATIMFIKKENISYPACPTAECNKKVTEESDGQWRCERCDKSFPRPQYRYVMTVRVQDHTGELYLSCFDDVGRMIMGCSADELQKLSEESEAEYLEKFRDANCKVYIFRCRAKQDNFQNQVRVRHSVLSASPPNYLQEGRDLVKMIQNYSISSNGY